MRGLKSTHKVLKKSVEKGVSYRFKKKTNFSPLSLYSVNLH